MESRKRRREVNGDERAVKRQRVEEEQQQEEEDLQGEYVEDFPEIADEEFQQMEEDNDDDEEEMHDRVWSVDRRQHAVMCATEATDEVSLLFHTTKYQFHGMALKKVTGAGRSQLRSSTAQSSILSGIPDLDNDSLRPIWVCPNGAIFLETFSPYYQYAYDFLIAIAEPVSRPELMHEYILTPSSLLSAVSVGFKGEDIINVLDRLSKTKLPESLVSLIMDSTRAYGVVKNRYYLESTKESAMERLLQDDVIRMARIKKEVRVCNADSWSLSSRLRAEDEDDLGATVHSFEIDRNLINDVKKACIDIDLPPLDEYDFRNDRANPDLPIELLPSTTIRPYQERALSKMFGHGRARSGVVVLPCGSGKTLVGITACSTIRKSTLVVCRGRVAVEQWRAQFQLWSTIKEQHIARFTADSKELFPTESGILITTYHMLASAGRDKAAASSSAILTKIKSREWGLLILDEVHVVAAKDFRNVFKITAAHCRLGLTATPLREDGKIKHLNHLIGPKLYEANWMDLQRAGHIASVQCAEVLCPMTPAFYRHYMYGQSARDKIDRYIMNPNKFQCCQFLVNYHEKRGDKTIVYSDDLGALRYYSRKLQRYKIEGKTPPEQRMKILDHFKRKRSAVNTIFLSTVGDDSIDLPDANVVIQISSHFGSGRQETQRVGRILRPKARTSGKFNAYFYSLVSRDTKEMYWSAKRQQFLANQGYSFTVITELPLEEDSSLLFRKEEDFIDLDQHIDERWTTDEARRDMTGSFVRSRRGDGPKKAVKEASNSLFGARRKPVHHLLFRKRAKDIEERKRAEAEEEARNSQPT